MVLEKCEQEEVLFGRPRIGSSVDGEEWQKLEVLNAENEVDDITQAHELDTG